MATKQEKLELYINEAKKFTSNLNEEKLAEIVDLLGPSIFNADAETVACSDEEELERVINSSVLEKLGVEASLDDAKAVCEKMGTSNRNKYRAIFYYLLAE
jgi:ribosomal protein L15